jgi:hypothetical protein
MYFIGQSVEPVTAHPALEELIRKSEALAHRRAALMKAGVEAGHLQEVRMLPGHCPDRGEIVRLMQGDEWDEAGQGRDDGGIDAHRVPVNLAAVGDAVSDGADGSAGGPAFEPAPDLGKRVCVPLAAGRWLPIALREHPALARARDEVGCGADALHLSLGRELRLAVRQVVEGELDARGARVQREDRARHQSGPAPRPRRTAWA